MNTGVCASIGEHPIGMLRRLRFRVTLNTDNRLMSDTSMTKEMAKMVDAFGWGLDDLEWITINGGEERVRPVPRAAAHHQRGGQAALRAAARRDPRSARPGATGDRRGHGRRAPPGRRRAGPDPRPHDSERAVPSEPRTHRHAAPGAGHRVAADRRDHGDHTAHGRAGEAPGGPAGRGADPARRARVSSTPPRSCSPTPTSGSSGSAATRRRSPPSRTSTSCRSRSPAGR